MEIISFGAGFTTRVAQLYKHLIKAGIRNHIFAVGAFVTDGVKYGNENIDFTMEPYMKKAKADGVVHTIAAPAWFKDADLLKMPFSRAKKIYFDSYRVAGMVGCKAIMTGPMFFDEIEERIILKAKKKKLGELSDEEQGRFDYLTQPRKISEREVFDFYVGLIDLAKENHLTVLIPNFSEYYNGSHYRNFASDPYRLKELINQLNKKAGEKLFSVNLNIGTCNILGQDFYQVISVLKEDIGLLTLSENDGQKPTSLMPFTSAYGGISNMDWLAIIKALRAIDYTGPMHLNYWDTYNAAPVRLRVDIVRYAQKMAEYLVWQIEMEHVIKKYKKRVLFGAGNMCRNYMKCYGNEYPPQFTCDNNKNIWGQEFEGLEIKNPEALKELPEDTAIFICNIYYDEIEEQLRNMGLNNPIERYNDEYLPTMYADRFDAEKREITKQE